MTTKPPADGRTETVVQTVILLAVAGMAGAASFTHVHDWTMHNSPAHTGDWFGWANAMVSELIPLAAGLEIRRRARRGQPAGRYPVALVLAAVTLSLAGQFAEAKPSISGWLISAVPALGFLALVKLVLSRPTAAGPTPSSTPAAVPAVRDVPAVPSPVPAPAVPAAATTSQPAGYPAPPLDPGLVDAARTAADTHHAETGRDITRDTLRAALRVSNATASDLLRAIRTGAGPDPAPSASVNGTRPDLADLPR